MQNNQDNKNKLIDWIIVIIAVVIFALYKLVPTVHKLTLLDKDGIIFFIVFSAAVLFVIFISKAIEKRNVQNHIHELNDDIPGNEELERRKANYLEKHGYDKKIGKTIIDDLTKRYRKEAVLPFWITVLLTLFTYSFFLKNDTQGMVYALIFTSCTLAWTIYKFCAVPVKRFKKIFDTTLRISITQEDYMNGSLICKKACGINIGKLFTICLIPKSIYIFPTGYIQNIMRCITYKAENSRGFLGSKKLEYSLLLYIKQLVPKLNKTYDLELYIPLDRIRLEIAYDVLREQNVPYEREYKYIEK